MVGKQYGSTRAEIKRLAFLRHRALTHGVDYATSWLEAYTLPCRRDTQKRAEHEIVIQSHTRELSRAFTERAAKSAVYSTVIFVLPDVKLGSIRFYVSEHQLRITRKLRLQLADMVVSSVGTVVLSLSSAVVVSFSASSSRCLYSS